MSVPLIASRRLVANGATVAAGGLFTVEDPERAAVLVRSGYASSAPDDAGELVDHLDRESSRGRAAARPAPRPLPAPRQRPQVDQTARLTDGLHDRDNSLTARRLRITEARLTALETALAALTDTGDTDDR